MQAQEEPPKEKIAAGASYRGYREADTRAEAEENQVKEQTGATRKRQAVVRKAPVPQTTHRKRRKDGTADGQDQPHPAPHLPTHTVQIGAPSPPAAEPNGACTPAPQKVVDSVLPQARGDAEKGAGGIVPLDLSGSGKEDAPDRETTGMEDPSRKDSRLELTAPRERGNRESMPEDRGASTLTVGAIVDPTTSDASGGLGGLVPASPAARPARRKTHQGIMYGESWSP